MKVYLVQHGEAKSDMEDPQRPLAEKGKNEVESVANYLAYLEVEVAQILHSGRLRAKQTAEIFARHLSPTQGVREEKGLGPLDDPQDAKRSIEQAERPLMIVGHLPHLSQLASLLILGTSENEIVRFRMAGVVCLGESDKKWLIQWALVPDLIHK